MTPEPAGRICKFSLSQPRPGMPTWANITAGPAKGVRARQDLAGGGVYACFWDDQLIYIGKFSGPKTNPFGGCVVDRIYKHMVGFTLRAEQLFFKPSRRLSIIRNLPDISEAGLRIAKDIEAADAAEMTNEKAGICATYNKARFASMHWHELEDMGLEELSSRFTFFYKRVDLGGLPRPTKQMLDDIVIAPIELELIECYEPICNTKGRRGEDGAFASPKEVAEKFNEVFEKHMSNYCDPSIETSTLQLLAEQEVNLDVNEDVDDDDDRDPMWPDESFWEIYTIRNGQLRVKHAEGSRPLLLVHESKHKVNCLASVESLSRRGVTAKPIKERGRMVSQVTIDWSSPETPQLIRSVLEASTADAVTRGFIPSLVEA